MDVVEGMSGVVDEVGGDDVDGPQLVSLYPCPPQPYYSQYGDDRVRRGEVPVPPPPPDDTYHIFGLAHELNASVVQDLGVQGIQPLYHTPCDRRRTIKRMNASLLASFLDLLSILTRSPNSVERENKMADMELLFIQLHHLLNTFRPMQARLSLVCLRQQQLRQTYRHIKALHRAVDTATHTLDKCGHFHTTDVAGTSLAEIRGQLCGGGGGGGERRGDVHRPRDTGYCVVCECDVELASGILAPVASTNITTSSSITPTLVKLSARANSIYNDMVREKGRRVEEDVRTGDGQELDSAWAQYYSLWDNYLLAL